MHIRAMLIQKDQTLPPEIKLTTVNPHDYIMPKISKTPHKEAHYDLALIRQYISDGKLHIPGRVKKSAEDAFGWQTEDIKKAISLLKAKHFHKTEKNWDNPSIYVDYYKARNLMGENIYTHFHIEDDKLIVASFKEI